MRHVPGCAAFVLLLSAQMTGMAQDIPAGAWAGRWKLNLAQSSFPGRPAPQDDQLLIQPDGTVTVFETNSHGEKSSWSYKPQAGRSVEVSGRTNWTVIARKVNEHRTEQRPYGEELGYFVQGWHSADISSLRDERSR
jgi:hypothetical protein